MFKIIIIGAGASGLAAASRLCQHGIDSTQITILEAENRIGGRIHTINKGSGTIEMGAQWVHGKKDNPVFALASDVGELLIDLETPISMEKEENFLTAYPRNGQIISSAQMNEFRCITKDIYESSRTELAKWNKSLGTFYIQKFQEVLKGGLLKSVDQETAQDLIDFVRREEILEIGCDDWEEADGQGFLAYNECEGNYFFEWKGGYNVLFDILMRNIPNGQQLPLSDCIHLNSPVLSIHWDLPDDKVKVNCKDKTFEADVVLVTCSLGVLKEKADQLFYPLLPEKKRGAIEGLGYGTVNKIYLEFRQKWWNDGWGGVNFLTQSADRSGAWFESILGFYTVHNQPNLLEGWVTGSAARIVETLPENELLEKCCSLLRGAVSSSFDYEEPIGLIRSQWHSNPNFRGSYSFRSLESKKRNVWACDLAEPVVDSKGVAKLFFAGEATHSHSYSNVHGAVETGWREADRIIQHLSRC